MIELDHEIRFLPIHLVASKDSIEQSLQIGEELELLIKTYGGTIVDRIVQKLSRPDTRTYIGRGKLGDVEKTVKEKQVDVVVLNAIVKPGQIYNLRESLWKIRPQIEVWDRVELILQIFQKHAKTKEAKLQIELAQMRHMGPRIYGMGAVMSRQGGGIGTLGVGETNTELMKRHWRDQMKKIHQELEKLASERQRQLERRQKAGLRTVSLVGYTNAGKTSLFNLLTRKNKFVANVLFATLDSSSGKVYIPEEKREILLTDTIGFMQQLPPNLISAFQSTLLESINADLLLHIIDVSDQHYEKKIHVVEQVLRELQLSKKPRIYVFNKIDKVEKEKLAELSEKHETHHPQFISTINELGIGELLLTIGANLSMKELPLAAISPKTA